MTPLSAPRNLNDPVTCKFSSFSVTGRPPISAANAGVVRTYGPILCAASRTSSLVTGRRVPCAEAPASCPLINCRPLLGWGMNGNQRYKKVARPTVRERLDIFHDRIEALPFRLGCGDCDVRRRQYVEGVRPHVGDEVRAHQAGSLSAAATADRPAMLEALTRTTSAGRSDSVRRSIAASPSGTTYTDTPAPRAAAAIASGPSPLPIVTRTSMPSAPASAPMAL